MATLPCKKIVCKKIAATKHSDSRPGVRIQKRLLTSSS